MGCGIGDFARRGLKMPKTQDFWVFILSPGDLDSQRHMGPRLAAQGTLTRSAGDLDSQRQGTLTGAASRGPLGTK